METGLGNWQFFSVAVIVLGLLGRAANAQTNEWTWITGSNTVPVCTSNFPNCSVSGVYGTLQTPASGNTPGGRVGAASWTDSKGNLWLFSGFGPDSQGTVGYPNDLWQFNPTTHLWAWMGGSDSLSGGTKASGADPGQIGVYGTLRTPAIGNIPGSRSNAFTWTDAGGNFWLFGGDGYDSAGGFGDLNDLWEFNPSTGQWAWMGGSTTVPANFQGQPGIYGTLGTPAVGNIPGGRQGGVSWTDGQGNLWLAGGYGAPSNDNDTILNDVWKFIPSSNEWAWMAGVSTVPFNVTGEPGVYGTLGIAAAGNLPGARTGAVSWTDSSGHVWLFGGDGDDSANTFGWLNDLWQLQPTSNEWAWIAGSETINAGELFPGQAGVYGTLQVPATQNTPGGRYHSVSWADKQGNLWLFGGWGYDSITSGFYGDLNDLWEFQPSTGQWAWMTGSEAFPYSEGPLPGHYGTLGTAAFGDTPGGRASAISWTDSTGRFWLFGGNGYDSAGNYGLLNDLWQFQPPTAGLTRAATPVLSPGSGTYTSEQTVTITDTTPGATISYLVNGNPPAIPYSAPIVISASETIEATAVAPGYTNSSVATGVYTVNLPLAALPIFSVATGNYSTTQTLTITDTTPGAAIYYTIGAQFYGPGGTPSTSSTLYTGPITIAASQTVKAIAVAGGYANSNVAQATYTIWPNPYLSEWTWMSGSNTSAPCSSQQLDCGQPGVYGTLGTPADINVPGARSEAATWTDKAGNLWLFGGSGFDSAGTFADLNDLWNFNTSTNQWTWMGGNSTVSSSTFGFSGVYGTLGKPASGNLPGSRYAADSWTDGSGNFWLFGGFGFDSAGNTGYLNDLWMFNPSTKQWTWASGSKIVGTVCNQSVTCASAPTYGSLGVPSAANIPGGRISSVTWVDKSGDLWLFGGNGADSLQDIGDLGDLWEFSPATSEWTWVDGGSTLLNFDDPGTFYGIQGVAGPLGVFAPANIPAGRSASVGWSDTLGNFWLFGGYGVDEFGFHGALNDLWEFKTSTGEWAWMGGYLTSSTLGFSGIEGTLAAANLPGALYGATGVTDSIGNFWLFGGFGNPPDGLIVSDALWEFNTSSSEWGWMNGVNNGGLAVYGTLRIPADTNTPGARFSANSWADQKGNIWVFGGNNAGGSTGYLNDLWKYVAVTAAAEPVFSPVAGTYTAAQTVTITDTTPNATIYFTTDGSAPTTSSTVYSSPITVSSTETLNTFATASGYSSSPIASALYTIDLPPPHPNFSITGPAISVTPGATAGNTSTITLTPTGGFTGTIGLTCAITPAAASDPATCNIPTSVTISGTAAQIATLTVNTTAASSALNGLGKSFRPFVGGTALATFLLICNPARRRRWRSTLGLLVLLFYIVGGAVSCSGGGSGGGGGTGGGEGGGNAGTTAGSYVITVTGTSGATTQTGTVSLTVK